MAIGYNKWEDSEDFDLLFSKLRKKVRLKRRRNRELSLGIVYSQSISWGNSSSLKSFDGNKKVKDINESYSSR